MGNGWQGDSWGNCKGCLRESIWGGKATPSSCWSSHLRNIHGDPKVNLGFLSPTPGFSTPPWLPPLLPTPSAPHSPQHPAAKDTGKRREPTLPVSLSLSLPTTCFQPVPQGPPPQDAPRAPHTKGCASRSVVSTRRHPMDSPGILPARTLEWVALPFSGDLPHPGFLHRRRILHRLSHQGRPGMLAVTERPPREL